jgi:hypothetical protein
MGPRDFLSIWNATFGVLYFRDVLPRLWVIGARLFEIEWRYRLCEPNCRFFIKILTLEDETTTLYRNVGRQSPSDVAPHLNRTETLTTDLIILLFLLSSRTSYLKFWCLWVRRWTYGMFWASTFWYKCTKVAEDFSTFIVYPHEEGSTYMCLLFLVGYPQKIHYLKYLGVDGRNQVENSALWKTGNYVNKRGVTIICRTQGKVSEHLRVSFRTQTDVSEVCYPP